MNDNRRNIDAIKAVLLRLKFFTISIINFVLNNLSKLPYAIHNEAYSVSAAFYFYSKKKVIIFFYIMLKDIYLYKEQTMTIDFSFF